MAGTVNPLDRRAVATGASVVVVVAVPFAVARSVLEADQLSNVVVVLFVGILAAFVAGGFVAARRAGSAPYSNSAVAAAAGWLVIQVVSVVLMVVRGDPVNPVVVVANGLAAYACGLVGGLLAGLTSNPGARSS